MNSSGLFSCFCNRLPNQPYQIYHKHLCYHLRQKDTIYCFCGQKFNTRVPFTTHLNIKHKDIKDKYFESFEDTHGKTRSRLKQIVQVVVEQLADSELDTENLNDHDETTVEEESGPEPDSVADGLSEEFIDQLAEFKLKYNVTTKASLDLVKKQIPILKKLVKVKKTERFFDNVNKTFKSDRNFNAELNNKLNYVEPKEQLIYQTSLKGIRLHYVPIDKSLEVMCSDKEMFDLLFNDRGGFN